MQLSIVHILLFFLIKVLVSSACLAELILAKCKSMSESIRAPSVVAPTVSAFFSRSTNSRVSKVTGSNVNRGRGYGLEIPCKYTFHGPKNYIDKLKAISVAK